MYVFWLWCSCSGKWRRNETIMHQWCTKLTIFKVNKNEIRWISILHLLNICSLIMMCLLRQMKTKWKYCSPKVHTTKYSLTFVNIKWGDSNSNINFFIYQMIIKFLFRKMNWKCNYCAPRVHNINSSLKIIKIKWDEHQFCIQKMYVFWLWCFCCGK